VIDPPGATGWGQLAKLWELIVLVIRFMWRLLQLLGGR
jgi:hypothetical protein